jgi:hypothetical protein
VTISGKKPIVAPPEMHPRSILSGSDGSFLSLVVFSMGEGTDSITAPLKIQS